jgi:ATP-dependent Lon protease
MRMEDWSKGSDPEEFAASINQRTEELYRVPDGEPDAEGFIECPAVVLRDMVVFPHMVTPIFITPGANLLAIQEAQYNYQTVVFLAPLDPEEEDLKPDNLLKVGTEIAIGRLLNIPDGNNSALVQGRRRVEVVEFTQLNRISVSADGR